MANSGAPPPQADELPLVSHKLVMACGERAAEVRQQPVAMVEDSAKPHARGVAVHHENLVEAGHLENGPYRKSLLEGLERLGRLRVPGKGIAAQEACQGHGDETELPNEFSVLTCEAEEAA
jgi:hypothetical protein